MEATANKLKLLLTEVPEKLNSFNDSEMSKRPMEKWSKKEILGHLCDSATNNHHRFVKIQFEKQPFVVSVYKQDDWVRTQNYQEMSKDEIIDWWVCLNKHILRVVSKIPKEKYNYLCDIGDGQTVTLIWLVRDYLDHMEHHLRQIFATEK